ncbi:MAG: hypothetical protein GVY34_05260 [Alphaproteobacteria bacterium]|jgi:hypothetical protein|nr:hypothetical protein [Alphaproteobacteria bacterium]
MQTLRQVDTNPQPQRNEAALTLLRVLMRTCRAKARMPVFEACALLHHSPAQSAQVYADALLRALVQALPKAPVIHTVTAAERSFDEAWLLALLSAIGRKDHASATFLLRARLPLHYRRSVGWLAAQLAERLDAENTDSFSRI